ncbi:MAG: flagellin lysine-N-methylase [Clostridia bacterium]|nr:flagellin lysine-N-methylase [Clostridia bacterium]
MKRVTPSYYDRFQCIADRCQHTCCVGWEIDIDDESVARYRTQSGPLGARLKAAMHTEDGVTSFSLDKEERCPFLNANGLCDLITALGHDALCEICATHPRFRFDYTDRTEWGLGLCCEAAATLILNDPHPMTLCVEDDGCPDEPTEEEAALLRIRDEAFALVQDRRLSIEEREEALLRRFCAAMPFRTGAAIAALLRPLERMDPAWDTMLADIAPLTLTPLDRAYEVAEEHLLCYFLYRQLPPALDDGCFAERAALAVLAEYTVRLLTLSGVAFEDAARAFSAEIEYSDQNIDALLQAMRRC